MGILGLTQDENGVALERLPVAIKVAIGEGPQAGDQNGHPRRLDHFVFKRKTLRGQDVVWEPAPDIAKVYGEKPTEFGIIFLNDDPKEVFRTEYAWWTPAGCRCRGGLVQISNGDVVKYEMRAIRRTQRGRAATKWVGLRVRQVQEKEKQIAEDTEDAESAEEDRQNSSRHANELTISTTEAP